jgi:hypothetical protein
MFLQKIVIACLIKAVKNSIPGSDKFAETFLHGSLQADFSKALTSDFSKNIFKRIFARRWAFSRNKIRGLDTKRAK